MCPYLKRQYLLLCHTCGCYVGFLLCMQLLWRVHLYLYPVLFCAVSYYGLLYWLKGYVRKLINLPRHSNFTHFFSISAPQVLLPMVKLKSSKFISFLYPNRVKTKKIDLNPLISENGPKSILIIWSSCQRLVNFTGAHWTVLFLFESKSICIQGTDVRGSRAKIWSSSQRFV